MKRAEGEATGLIKTLRLTFAIYGIPDELSSDGRAEFVSHTTSQFLRQWGVHHRLSSVAFIHSNCRGHQNCQRLISRNVVKDGAINIDAF